MDYAEFCRITKTELPLNRKERFYTGTVLPALLFHNGYDVFYDFVSRLTGFPSEVNQHTTGDSLLFYSEYNLRQSAGSRSVGAVMDTPSNETPDIIIEILQPKQVFVIIEGKMFHQVSQEQLNDQIRSQRMVVTDTLREQYCLDADDFFHVALVPKASGISSTPEFQVVNWEYFLTCANRDLETNIFYNYLRFALEHYPKLVSRGWSPPTTVQFKMKGSQLLTVLNDGSLWIGRKGGRRQIRADIESGRWRHFDYCVNSVKPVKGRPGNWVTLSDFKYLVGECAAGD